MAGELEADVAQRLIRHLPERLAHELLHRERLGLGLLPLGQEPADLRAGF